MLKVDQYSSKGIKTSDYSLPKEIEVKENLNLLAQAIRVYESREHPGLSKVKTRSEVNRTTKKWYRQKGTGRARHGARSAPIFVGGGSAHGPKGIKRVINLPKIMSKKSLYIAITIKAKMGKLLFVNSISALKKTKEAMFLVDKICKNESNKNNITVVFSDKNKEVRKFFRNIKNVKTDLFSNLNARKVILSDLIIFDKDVFDKEKPKGKK